MNPSAATYICVLAAYNEVRMREHSFSAQSCRELLYPGKDPSISSIDLIPAASDHIVMRFTTVTSSRPDHGEGRALRVACVVISGTSVWATPSYVRDRR